MSGSLRQRGERSWQLRVHAGRDSITGRKRYVEKTFHGTRRQAERALAALVTETDSYVPRNNKEATLGRLLNEWLENMTPSFSPRTVTVTKNYIEKSIVPKLGAIPVSKLSPLDLDRFYRHLLNIGGPRGEYSPSTIRRIHGIIRSALSQGVRWGCLRHNPAIDASPPRVPVRRLSPPEPELVVRLFKIAKEADPALAAFVVLAAATGARRGELIALRWDDLDLERATMTIERGVVLADGELTEQMTKTHQSRRLALDGGTVQTMRKHYDHAKATAEAFGFDLNRQAFVFSNAVDGSIPWRPDSTTSPFRSLCDRAGVKGIRLHDLRHYVATRLLAAGVDIRTVAGRLGHRNPSTTLNVYAHFVPQSDHEAAVALGRLFDAALKAAD